MLWSSTSTPAAVVSPAAQAWSAGSTSVNSQPKKSLSSGSTPAGALGAAMPGCLGDLDEHRFGPSTRSAGMESHEGSHGWGDPSPGLCHGSFDESLDCDGFLGK